MKKFFSIIMLALFAISQLATAQDEFASTISPKAYHINDGVVSDTAQTSFSGSAPYSIRFDADASNPYGYSTNLVWRIYKGDMSQDTYFTSFDDSFDYEFRDAGTFYVCCMCDFFEGTDTIKSITLQDYKDNTYQPITVTISTSKLTFPNAISPNGDDKNDVFKAKTCESIVEFKGTIYNRYGQKLYEWTDPHSGWDGTYHGKVVKNGVYFAQIKAKGSDGVKYNIKTDINVLTGFTETTGSSSSDY